VLTPVGQHYLADVTGSLADLSRATERASSDTSVEILRIHSSPSFGLMWLLPRLASFHEANDDIQLNLACSYEDVSFTSGYYDLDMRHGYAHWTDVTVKTLRNEFIAPLASEDYLRRCPVRTPEDLLDRRLIYSETPLLQWSQWFGKFGVAVPRKAYDFSFDRSYMSLEAAALGHGIALESTMLASMHLKRGSLVPVFERTTYAIEVGAHHIVYPSQNAELSRVAKFLVWSSRKSAGTRPGANPSLSRPAPVDHNLGWAAFDVRNSRTPNT
jgi:LysR family glycine cleavage system transcriptional activator